jgi:hypothetical protein
VKERVNKTSNTRTGIRMYRMGQHTLRYEWEGYQGICGFCFSTFDLASVALIEIPRYHSRYRRVRAYAVIERGQVNWTRKGKHVGWRQGRFTVPNTNVYKGTSCVDLVFGWRERGA